ncbi:MAG: hypothetical protein WBO73_20245, partial [Gammaproteobacteria bacterium]
AESISAHAVAHGLAQETVFSRPGSHATDEIIDAVRRHYHIEHELIAISTSFLVAVSCRSAGGHRLHPCETMILYSLDE